ncbi:flagellar capping protein [compost metagenome]
MLATSPLYMVNTYRNNHDYYRVSAVHRIPAGQTNTIRPSMQFSYEQSAYTQYARKAASGLATFIQTAQEVKQSAQSFLTGGAAAAVNQRIAVSSKPESLKGEAKTGATLQNYRIKLSAIASAQSNSSLSMEPDSITPVQPGWNQLSLKQNGEELPIEIYIGSEETIKDTLSKIRFALNQEGVGVRSRMEMDDTGKVHLSITSEQIGSSQAFSLTDVKGNVVTALGLNEINIQANQAIYSINGDPWLSSDSNIIELDHGRLQLKLLQPAAEDLVVSIEPDSDAILQPIEQLISDYNQFQFRFQDTPDYLNRSLVQGLEHAAKPFELEELHIKEQSDGTLYLQANELKQQITNNYSELKSSLSRINQLASGLADNFRELEDSPALSLFQLNNSSLQRYSHYESQLQAYLPVPMTGILLDNKM